MIGIVVKRVDFSNTSLVVSVLCPDRFITFISKGAKRKGKTENFDLSLGNIIEFDVTKSVNMPTLTSVSVLDSAKTLIEDILRYTLVCVCLEYVSMLAPSFEDLSSLYDVLSESIKNIKSSNDPELDLFKFEISLSKLVGIDISPNHIRNDYGEEFNSLIMNILESKDFERDLARKFFSVYFSKELNINLKSKKFYFDLYRELL